MVYTPMPLKIQFPRPSLFSKQSFAMLLFTQHWYGVFFLRQMCQKTKLIVRLFSSSHPSQLIPDRICHIPSVKCCHGLYTHAIQPFIIFALKTRCHSIATYYWRFCHCVMSHLPRLWSGKTIRPHYNLPYCFMSWAPKSIDDLYMKCFNKRAMIQYVYWLLEKKRLGSSYIYRALNLHVNS